MTETKKTADPLAKEMKRFREKMMDVDDKMSDIDQKLEKLGDIARVMLPEPDQLPGRTESYPMPMVISGGPGQLSKERYNASTNQFFDGFCWGAVFALGVMATVVIRNMRRGY